MIYVVRVYDGPDVYEYEYGNERHAREHMAAETCRADLFIYARGCEIFMDSINKGV